MDKNRFKAKPVLDFTDKKITVIDVIQKLKEINNDIKETSTEIESFEKLFKDNTRFRYNTQIETKSEYLNDIFVQISGANSNDVLKIAKYELSRIKANQRKEQEIKDEKKEKFNKELKDQIDKCKEKFEKRKQTNNAGPTFEKFFFTTNGEIVYVDCITEYLYMVITFQGIIEIWEIYNKDDELFTSLKYIENINCSGITNACKLNSIDVTDYKTVNEDFRNANKSSNGKNFKIQQVNQLNAKNIENETIKINSILTYKNSIIYNIVALTKNIDSNAIGKYNTVGLKVINEIYMLLAQYKFYKELQEEKRKKNELKLIDSYKLNVSENTINKYGSAFSVNYSDVMNTMPKIKESTTESISSFNEMKNNKNNNATEDGIILNKIIVRMKTNYFLGNINGIGIIMNIIISENIITGEYIISHHIGNQLQLSTQSILVSEYNYRDNILFMPIYNELKEPYIMAWSIPSFNVEWLCKLSILSDIENQNIIQNVASDDMIIEEKLKQFVKTKNSTQILGRHSYCI
ncbi:hypothetical protein BCR32DRAFT_129365 [Anaeromyces robustus]|uniref:Uncharacterized protein n=1 Tax=Anaeromyces robustus TaxID=1754192 RepID=A0A1Y1XG48_9FUNG|nr:hypothetical protein BCR32DRAFT_129365 [Anaeromyces robustus]|eukprot:ORX84386.1 hypothetical protein BCR32DRAFT_129365 [Anaeromyces robustus]